MTGNKRQLQVEPSRATTQRMTTKRPKDAAMNFRVPESLRASCEAAAEKRGLDLSSWLRMVLTDATRSK